MTTNVSVYLYYANPVSLTVARAAVLYLVNEQEKQDIQRFYDENRTAEPTYMISLLRQIVKPWSDITIPPHYKVTTIEIITDDTSF